MVQLVSAPAPALAPVAVPELSAEGVQAAPRAVTPHCGLFVVRAAPLLAAPSDDRYPMSIRPHSSLLHVVDTRLSERRFA